MPAHSAFLRKPAVTAVAAGERLARTCRACLVWRAGLVLTLGVLLALWLVG
jgi:hypothetical protein